MSSQQVDLQEMIEDDSITLKKYNEVSEASSLLDFYKVQCEKNEQDMLDLMKKIDEVRSLT
jgi:hypothetical protein